MRRDLTSRVFAASIVLALLVGAVVSVLAVTLYGFRDTASRSRRSEEAIASADRLEKVMLDLETGERGFMLTRQSRFLDPWRAAGRQLSVEARRLTPLANDNSTQQRRAEEIVRGVRRYYRTWSLPIVRLARSHPAQARARVSSGAGKRQVDTLRRRFERFIDAEQEILNHRREAATAGGQRAAFFALGGIAATAVLILLFAGYLAREIVVPLRRMAAAARELAAGNLRARVPETGPGELGALAEAFNSMAGSLEEGHEQVAAHNSELARRAGINRAVLEATNEAIAMFDPAGRLVLTNPAMDRLLALVGTRGKPTLLELAAHIRIATKDPEMYWKVIAAATESPDFEAFSQFELVDTRKVFASYTGPVREADGRIIGRLFVIRDVTDEREADRVKTELVATVSHELRTPLASILGFSEVMATHDTEPEAFRRYAQTVHRQAKRLTDLINDFLDLQRIESHRLPLAVESFDLGQLLAEQVEAYSGQSELHRLDLRSGEGPALVHADRERTAQVVGNLLSNAIKYSPHGGVVQVSLVPQAASVRVEVTDQGLGIPDEQQSKLFTKFFRVDSSDTRSIGGTGLGLALSRELVQAQGGRIGFESSLGLGSTFWFELPAAQAGELRRAV